jgi:hypothetical protein
LSELISHMMLCVINDCHYIVIHYRHGMISNAPMLKPTD